MVAKLLTFEKPEKNRETIMHYNLNNNMTVTMCTHVSSDEITIIENNISTYWSSANYKRIHSY